MAAQVDADLELAARTPLRRRTARWRSPFACKRATFGGLNAEAVAEVAIPLMWVVVENGYRHAERVKMFGPLGRSPRKAVEAVAARYRETTFEERGQLLVECVEEALRGEFIFEGEQAVDEAFESFWTIMQGALGNEPRFDAPARDAFRFGAALYPVGVTIVLELLREDRHARAKAAIRRNESRRRLRSWSR